MKETYRAVMELEGAADEFPALRPPTEQRLRHYCESLSESDRRRDAAVEASKFPHGGMRYIAAILGCCERTISRGLAELDSLPETDPAAGHVRRPGSGRPKGLSSLPNGSPPSADC